MIRVTTAHLRKTIANPRQTQSPALRRRQQGMLIPIRNPETQIPHLQIPIPKRTLPENPFRQQEMLRRSP